MKTIKIIHVEVGDMPQAKVEAYLAKVKENFMAEGVKHIVVIPTRNGVGSVSVTETPLR